MEYITLSNTMIKRDDISALEYIPRTEITDSQLEVYLRGGEKLTLNGDEADKVWNEMRSTAN